MGKDETFIKQMIKKYGEDILLKEGSLEVISTDSMALDASIGIGGIPKKRFTEIYGPEGTAKTTICLHCAKNVLLAGGKVLYIDVENMLDYAYAKSISGASNIGPESKEFVVLQPNTAEDAFTIAEEGVLSKEFDLIIFDSIGGLAPAKVKKDDMEDANVAIIPKLVTKFLQKTESDIRINNIAFIFVNQVRDNIGSYVQGYITPGGHMLKHLTSLIIQLNKGTPIKIGDDHIGSMITFTIKKNKLAPPFRSSTIPIIFGKGIDITRDMIMFGETIGVLSKAGPYIKFGEKVLGRGNKETSDNLIENPDLYNEIRSMILDSISKYNSPKEDLTEEE